MNKKQLLLVVGGIVLLGIGSVIGVLYEISSSANHTRANLKARYSLLQLPGTTPAQLSETNGCNGLDYNDCAEYIYNFTTDQHTAMSAITASLSTAGYTTYQSADPVDTGMHEVDAFNHSSNLYISLTPVALSNSNQLDVSVGEASNGRYAAD